MWNFLIEGFRASLDISRGCFGLLYFTFSLFRLIPPSLCRDRRALDFFLSCNLVPRLFHLTAPAPEERPWFRLVTCLANKHNPLGGVPLSNKMSRRAFVTLKARLADNSTNMFFSSLHFVIVNSSYWNINLKPKQVKCLEAVYNGKTLLPYCRQDTESPLSSIFFHRSCSTN